MTPSEFHRIVREALEAAKAEPLNMRLMLSAVALTDMLAARLFWSDAARYRAEFSMSSKDDDLLFRERLCCESNDFRILRDMAKAHKHVQLTRKSQVKRADQTRHTAGLFQAPFGEGVFAEAAEIIVELDDKTKRSVFSVLENAVRFLEGRFPSLTT